jgi:hypothetical protein
MISRNSRPAEFRKADLNRLASVIDQLREAMETQDSHEGGLVDHDERVSGANSIDPSDQLEHANRAYTLPFARDPAGDEGHGHLDFATDFYNMNTLSPDQLLEIASLFDRAPQHLDESGFDGNQSWLWSN